jgi:hypothetical protein
VKRYLKDWCITKELALDRREWKLAIQNLDFQFLPFIAFCQVFFRPFLFFDLILHALAAQNITKNPCKKITLNLSD